MKIVILNGSHRLNGNCYRFAKTAYKQLGERHQVILFNLIEQKIKPCNGCLNCEEGMECDIQDDYSKIIMPALMASDLIVFASPTYFNMPSAAMVNLLDRTNNLCEYFADNPKKALIYLVGQTDEDTIMDAYKCVKTYLEIMGMEEALAPIIKVIRMPEQVDSDVLDILKNI